MKFFVIEAHNIGTDAVRYLDFDKQCHGAVWFPSSPARAHFFESKQAAEAEVKRWMSLPVVVVNGEQRVPPILRALGDFTAATKSATLQIRIVELDLVTWSDVTPTVVVDWTCFISDPDATEEATITFTPK